MTELRTSGRTRALVAAGALLLALAALSLPSDLIESVWARHVLPWASSWIVPWSERPAPTVTPVPGGLAGSWAWLAALVLGSSLAVSLVGAVAGSLRRRNARPLGVWAGSLASTMALVVLASTLLWGLGLRRAPLADLLQLPASPSTGDAARPQAAAPTAVFGESDAVDGLARDLLEVVDATHGARPTDDDPDAFAQAVRAVGAELGAIVDRATGASPRIPSTLKAAPAGSLLAGGFSGLFVPVTLEPHVDAGLPAWERLAAGAHELAHAAGMGREADAEALGLLAALRSDDPSARYAAALAALARIARTRSDSERQALLDRLPSAARRDLDAAREAHARYASRVWARITARTYDTWLRSVGQREGLRAYDGAIELLARAWRSGWRSSQDADATSSVPRLRRTSA